MGTVMPSIRELTDAEARALLARGHVGRLAYDRNETIEIEPITYSYDDDWIFGRTSVGTKLASLAQHPRCAFEIDEVAGPFEWMSVVVKGTFYLLDPEAGSPALYGRAMEKVRELVPAAFSYSDPAPTRSFLFGIYVSTISGRASEMAAAPTRAPSPAAS
jgi:nitroimidazol reductase NimA-like FMN-containing flavoprotein (pyridoxamine 5'-phosphate oxidase superfamily)